MKTVLFACGLGVALCSGPVAAAGGADVPVRVEAKKIVILDCGQTKLQNELKRTLDYITDGDVKILKPAHVPPFESFVIRLGQAPVKTTEQLLEEGDETAASRAKGQVDWQVDEKGVRIWGGLGRADLGPVARKMLEDLKTDNEHGRIFVRAWISRTPEQVRDLVDYRKTHGLPSHWGYEKEFLELSTKDER